MTHAPGDMRRSTLMRLMGSSVLSQVILSGGNFLVAFALLRRLGAEHYGFYVLVSVTLLLLASLQGAFFQAPIVLALARLGPKERRALVGGVARARERLVFALALLALALSGLGWWTGLLDAQFAALAFTATLSGVAVLYREFFRVVLLAHHRTGDVLLSDVIYVALLVLLSFGATFLKYPTEWTVIAIGIAAWVSGWRLSEALWRFEPWDLLGAMSTVRQFLNQGGWAVFGAAVHWTFSQGYTYLVAAMLDVRAVAALAATRLLLMPLNTLSTGVKQSVFPLVSRWHEQVGLRSVLPRLLKIIALLVIVGLVYSLCVWIGRDWLFEDVLKKRFDHQDLLLVMWIVVFTVSLIRDQLGSVLAVRSRLQALSNITLVGAVLALLAIRFAIPVFGPAGALIGILVGETVNIAGMLVLTGIEVKRASTGG